MRNIDLIVIHCSASPDGSPVSVEVIDAWHKARGFKRTPPAQGRLRAHWLKHIGYHYVVLLDGTLAPARGHEEVGAHCQGHNLKSLGICMVGTSRYSRAQWATLSNLVRRLMRAFPEATVMGHRDLSPDADGDGVVERHEWLKTCPGFEVAEWLKRDMEPTPELLLKDARK